MSNLQQIDKQYVAGTYGRFPVELVSGKGCIVKDSAGKSYTAKILEKDSDEMEVRVSGLKKGTKYTVKVSGVRLKSAGGSYGSVSKSITVK